MNSSNSYGEATNSSQHDKKPPSPDGAPSSSSSPPSHGVSRISIGVSSSINDITAPNNNNNNHSSNNNSSSSLMNGNGEILVRRSPVSHAHSHTNQTSISSGLGKNYHTLGSPSIATSYNSEDVSDILNSSSLGDYNAQNQALYLNESLCSKVEQLQKQVEALTDTQFSQDERYKRSRQENEDLLTRIHLLEDQLRELEIQSDNKAQEDERRFKETMAKQMKQKSQECEQHMNANYQLQQEIIGLQRDLMKSESQIRSIQSEKEKLELELNEKNSELLSLDEEVHKLKLLVKHLKDEENVKSNLINILNEELVDNQNRSQQSLQQQQHHTPNASFTSSSSNNHNSPKYQKGGGSNSSRRSSTTSGFGDSEHQHGHSSKVLKDYDLIEANLCKLREENKQLKELNEELQAQLLNVQLEEGRSLIQEGNKSYSLADEMGDIDVHKLMEALKEQQDVNSRLRKYIDDILLKIVENNPEILEK